MTRSNRNIAISTKSLLFEKRTGEAEGLFKGGGKYIEISVIFAGQQRRGPVALGTAAVRKEDVPNSLLRFVKEVVLRNQGIIRMGTNEERRKALISLRFPVERRKVVPNRSLN